MIRKKKRIRKNPELESEVKNILSDFGKNIKFKYLSKGTYAETYYFVIKDSDFLPPGEYVLKILMGHFEPDNIKYMLELSKYGLIPKIYYMSPKFQIMRFIEGVTLSSLVTLEHDKYYSVIDLKTSLSNTEINVILTKVWKLLKNWHKLGFFHGDLHEGNIMISDSGKIYLIDPQSFKSATKKADTFQFSSMYKDLNFGISEKIINERLRKLIND